MTNNDKTILEGIDAAILTLLFDELPYLEPGSYQYDKMIKRVDRLISLKERHKKLVS